jgi:hypothetical protein
MFSKDLLISRKLAHQTIDTETHASIFKEVEVEIKKIK